MVELSPQHQQFVDAQVSAGLFQKPAEVVGAALDLLQQRQAEVAGDLALSEEYVQAELARGLAAIEAGDRVAWDPQRIKEEGRQRLASRKVAE